MSALYKFLGVCLILIDLPWMWLPVPFGAVLVALGLALLITGSETGAERLRGLRSRYHWFDRALLEACRYLPTRLADPIDRTACRNEEERRRDREGGQKRK